MRGAISAVLVSLSLIGGALAQTVPGQLPAGNVLGNPTGARARPVAFPIFSTANAWTQGQTFSSGATIGNVNSVWTTNGAIVNRISDRLFVGAAAAVNGGNVPESPKDWLETLFNGATQNAQMVAISTLGLTGATFASRASDWPSTGVASNSIGAAFYGFANNTTGTLLHGAWGGYGECDKSASVNANCFALELDAANYGSVVDVAPSAMFPSAGTTVNIQNGCGGVNGGTASCTAVMTVLSNTQKFRKGIVFGAASLDTALGTGGNGVAAEMGVGQSTRWLDTSGNLAAEIYSVIATNPFLHFNGGTNGQFSFDINGSAFLGMNSTNVFPNNTNTVNLGTSSFRWATVASVLGDFSGAVTYRTVLQAGTIYSAAGTALPTCNSGMNGASAVVSDATGATYAGAYTSGGAQTRRVLCVNGTGWITN